MTFLELAEQVLEKSEYPLSSSQIWKQAELTGLVSELDSQGKTPSATLASQLYTRTKLKLHDTIGFVDDTRPVRFLIKGKAYPSDAWNFDNQDPDNQEKELKYKEADLHPLLAYYIREHMYAYPKTIIHQKSKKVKYRQWEHPDMVACSFPDGIWNSKAYEVATRLGETSIEYYSFEIKKSLSFSNLREYFFQAVSNSSWADKGYLVVAEMSQDVELWKELSRLSESFGIGVIVLDTSMPESSHELFESKEKKELDVSMMDKLCGNTDYNNFLDRTMKDLANKEIRDEWYDKLWNVEDLVMKLKS